MDATSRMITSRFLASGGCRIAVCCLIAVVVQGCTWLGAPAHSPQTKAAFELVNAGSELLIRGRKQQALNKFDAAVTAAPSSLEVYERIIHVLYAAGMHRENAGYIVQAINIPPKPPGAARQLDRLRDSELYLVLGDTFWQLDLLQLSQEAYRQAIFLNDRNATAYNDLGYHYAEAGIRLDEALELTQRAVELEPRNGYFVDSLGWTYFQLGKHKRALELLKTAAELSPSEPEIRYHLGRAFESVGNVQAARLEYRKTLCLKPTFAEAKHRMGRLGSR